MKKNIISTTALLVFISMIFLSSCNGTGSRGTKNDVVFDSIVVKQQIPLLHENDSTLPYADVNVAFIYPVQFRDEASLARLQEIFKGTFFGSTEFDAMTPKMAMDEYVGRYSVRYKSLSNSYYEDKARLKGKTPAWYWYYMNTHNKIVFQDDSLLSYAVEYSDYEGGAHGSYRITYTNIDLNRLVTLTEEDLFVPDYYRPLTEKIVQSLMKTYDVSEPDSLLTKGFFTIEDIVPNNNFWLNREGIHYTYNQYEIAPYSMGTIDVEIPYTELEDILLYMPVEH
ncbi:MAG: DUF3298 and DUF4163 domain-containing protein [Porphyromonadaceae bacterium]|nr:DUF3298 and DUF4163 domain-containing protein [Porphyromonadaceae bacterium]